MPDGMLRIATWNVNSIRTRLDRVLDWLERAEVDVLAMQETKCADDQFPTMPFLELGYEVAHCGFNQWNGVAIASRVGLDHVRAELNLGADHIVSHHSAEDFFSMLVQVRAVWFALGGAFGLCVRVRISRGWHGPARRKRLG